MPGPSANPTACAVVRKPIQRPCFESGIVSPTIDIAEGIKPESNIPSTKRMGMNSRGTLMNASSRLVTIKPAREMKRIGLRPMRPDQVPIGVLKRNIPRPKAPSINASISGPSPRACKRCGKTGRITAKPVIIRVTQPIRNARAAVVDRDCLTGEAAIGLSLAYKNGAAALHRFTNESDHFLSLGIHQGNPGGRGSGVWIVLGTPIRHVHQDRDEIETFFRQDILLFALIFLKELFHQNALVFQMSETAGKNVGRHPFF